MYTFGVFKKVKGHKSFSLLFYLILILHQSGMTQLRIPDMSPRATVSQRLGLTNIVLNYSRPSLKGRIGFGKEGVVPYNQKWRTGANGVTIMECDRNIVIQGKSMSSGKYALLTTPGEQEWTLEIYLFEKNNWDYYVDKIPELSLVAPVQTLKEHRESLLLYFDHLNMYNGKLVVEWGNHQISLDVTADAHEKVLADIHEIINGPSNFDYYFAALYLHETQTDLTKALEYIQEVTKHESAMFFQVYREALILKDLNYHERALQSAKRSKELSKAAKNNDFVRLNDQLINALE